MNWKFISRIIFKDVEGIKYYYDMTAQLHAILKEKFSRCFDQWKTRWNKCQEDDLEKTFHSLLLFAIVNIAS